jgi:hypothetical protein
MQQFTDLVYTLIGHIDVGDETPITLKNKIATNHNKELNSIHTFQNIQVSTTGETILTIMNICTNWS